MNVFRMLDESAVLAASFSAGNRVYVVDKLLSDLYTREEAIALVVNMAISLPSDKLDFLADLLNNRQELEGELNDNPK